ncbi:MAG: diacylglycerol kinase family lipid kinase [Candidatus Dormibacteraeota bacterium]|uniref:Diacylglycerol kinase family lipid kinase n=1 Tax=Candidatus Dormiibacter inghamiae TaxID=3127013 RepID=A0A934K8B2_9BACT|nr:diacylglycerol kinase family lipid kinase [Candidatus Dormibacteraeota bacterium]MBJ7607437.1 diacylglycerol kinase family lipid kinase [Candidatus Dormibacteraeota bacterium]
MKEIMIVMNPAAAGGRTGRGWPERAARLRAAGLDFDVALTGRRGHATEIAREAVRAGRRLVVAAGGDGTINEVANGFFDGAQPVGGRACLGVLPMGTGGDFRRSFGFPTEPEAAAAMLKRGVCRRLDVGRVRCTTADGLPVSRLFVNIASAGMGAEVVDRVERSGRLAGGEATFLLATVATGLRWRNKRIRAVLDGREHEVVARQVVVANCRYYGGGMHIAPPARPDDGRLDVIVVGDLGVLEGARALRQFRQGTHLQRGGPKIWHALAREIELSTPDEAVRLEIDGERPGQLPAKFDVLPHALELVVP